MITNISRYFYGSSIAFPIGKHLRNTRTRNMHDVDHLPGPRSNVDMPIDSPNIASYLALTMVALLPFYKIFAIKICMNFYHDLGNE